MNATPLDIIGACVLVYLICKFIVVVLKLE